MAHTLKHEGKGRFVCEFDEEFAALLMIAKRQGASDKDLAQWFEERVVRRFNQEQKTRIAGYLNETRDGIRGDLTYTALELGDHKIDGTRVKVCRKQFHRAKVEGKDVGIACNGFVWGGNGVDNFALKGRWEYLR